MRRGGGGEGGGVHSTLWKFSLHFVHIFRKDWNFLTKFGSSDPSYNWTILTLLYLKFETFAHAQITIVHYYVLFTKILFDKWSWSMILSTWSRDFSKNVFWSVSFGLSFCQICYVQSQLFGLFKCWYAY